MAIALPWIQRHQADKLRDAKSGYANFKLNVPPSASGNNQGDNYRNITTDYVVGILKLDSNFY
jgi:hypothetical protein